MKKELFTHLGIFALVFAFVSLFKFKINNDLFQFWVGGVIGTFLPDVDHLLYIFMLRPYELTSQRVKKLLTESNIIGTLDLLSTTRDERKNLILHTFLFTAIAFILTFWVISSSVGMLGKGLMLAFLLHIVIDQIMDYSQTNSLSNWTWQTPYIKVWLEEKANSYRSLASLAAQGFAFLLVCVMM